MTKPTTFTEVTTTRSTTPVVRETTVTEKERELMQTLQDMLNYNENDQVVGEEEVDFLDMNQIEDEIDGLEKEKAGFIFV